MKNILLLIAICMFFQNSFAQEDTICKKSYIYCEIVGTSKLLSNKLTVSLDFGQLNKFASDQRLVDESGKPVVFNSMVDAMNWMGKDGWEFVQAYVVTMGQAGNVYRWLLKMDLAQLTEEERNEVMSKLQTKAIVKELNKDTNVTDGN